jgi:internalin A
MLKPFIAILAASASLLAAVDPATWIAAADGTLTRDRAGRVTGVNLSAGWVTDSDMASLAALPNLTHLDLSLTRITDRGLQDLKTAPDIEDLNLYYAEFITDQGLSVVKGWKHLKHLNVRGTKASDSTLEFLSNMDSLESVDIAFAMVTDIGLNHLTSLPNLKELSIGGNKLTDVGLLALREMPALTSLDLSGTHREDSGLWFVSITDEGMDAISTLKNMQRLVLSGTTVTARNLAKLKTLGKLERLDLQDCNRVADDSVPVLQALRALRVVDLTGTKVTEAGLTALRHARPELRVLAGASTK